MNDESNLIFYNSPDGKVRVALMARDGQVWMSQNQLAQLFGTSQQNISHHIVNILKEGELNKEQVHKYYLYTAELRVKERKDLTLRFWRSNVDSLLQFQNKNVLLGLGSISHKEMTSIVREVYDAFNEERKRFEALQADKDDLDELTDLFKD